MKKTMQRKDRKKVKSHNLKGRRVHHARWVMVLLLLEIGTYYICGLFRTPQDIIRYGSADYIKYIRYVLGHPFENYLTALTGIAIPVVFVIWLMQYATALDKGNKKYMPGKEMGSARWEDIDVFNKKLKSDNEKGNMILTKHARKMYDKKTLLNNNVTVVGGSGAGKTAGFIAPNLLQFYGSNIYVDPKGDTLEDFGPALVKEGIPFKVLNLCSMLESNQYNPFRYITEEQQIDQIINNIIANTTPKDAKGASDPFWEKAEILCEKALFFYIWLECPQPYYKYTQEPLNEDSEEIEARGESMYKTPILDEKGNQIILKQTMRSFIMLLGEAEVKEKDYELSDLGCRMLVLEEKLMNEGKLPEQHKALDSYNRVMRGAKDTVRSIVISVNARFSAFNTEKVLRIFDDDELELETFGTKQQALFLIIPDDDSTYNFIVGMLYTQFFQTLYRVARNYSRNWLPIPVGFWMDEFANIKMPNDFEKILSTCRSRNIYIVIILQSLAQIKTLYPNDAHEGILGNCDTFVYLGGNEKSSQEYVSETLGKWTIDKRTDNQTMGKQGSVSVNNDILGRELMTEDEVSMLGNHECIVKVRGIYPIRDDKCYWFQNPEYTYVTELPAYKSDVLVRLEGGRLVTVKYKSPYKFLSEDELKKMKEEGNVVFHEYHPADLLMMDIMEENMKDRKWKEFEENGLQLYREIDLEEMDDKIEGREKEQKEEEESVRVGLSELLEKYSYSDEQMEVIIEALNEDVPMKDIAKFALPERSVKQMRYMKELIQKVS